MTNPLCRERANPLSLPSSRAFTSAFSLCAWLNSIQTTYVHHVWQHEYTPCTSMGQGEDMSLSLVHSRALVGLQAPAVTVEVHLANGLPSFTIVDTISTYRKPL